jgi:cytosine permease
MATATITPKRGSPEESKHELGHDDYALERVPQSARYSWFSIATQRFGQLACLSQFLLGATLGFGMTLWHAVLAITLGCVILEIVAVAIGIAGQREGLSTSVLSRWLGFGRSGSALIGLVIAISLIGWFGIQNAVFAEGVHSLIGGLPEWAWTVICGAAVTAVVVWGFSWMTWTAYITVPAFLALAAWAISSELTKHSFSALWSSAIPGPALTVAAGTTVVAGGFIVGTVITADMTRYNRSAGDVIKQTLLSVTLGEYAIGIIGALLAHAVKSSSIVDIVTSSTGSLGLIILITATIKINDWNLYSSSLGIVNAGDQLLSKRFSRPLVTLIVGAVGTGLAAAGILNHFETFLDTLGIAVPPIAGIMAAEYWIVRAHARPLQESRQSGSLPSSTPNLVPASLIIWIASFLIGKYVDWGIAALNSLIAAFVLYTLAGKLGLASAWGTHHAVEAVGEPDAAPATLPYSES